MDPKKGTEQKNEISGIPCTAREADNEGTSVLIPAQAFGISLLQL